MLSCNTPRPACGQGHLEEAFDVGGARYDFRYNLWDVSFTRHLPFLRSMLKEANRYKRQELLQHGSEGGFYVVRQMVLNLLTNKIPLTPPVMAQLSPRKKVLCEVGKRKNSVKKRHARLMSRKGKGLWKGLNNFFCQTLPYRQ